MRQARPRGGVRQPEQLAPFVGRPRVGGDNQEVRDLDLFLAGHEPQGADRPDHVPINAGLFLKLPHGRHIERLSTLDVSFGEDPRIRLSLGGHEQEFVMRTGLPDGDGTGLGNHWGCSTRIVIPCREAMTEKAWEVLPPEEPTRRDEPGVFAGRRARLGLAFAIAVASDLMSVWLEFVPPLQWALDGGTALALFLILGRQWLILPALVAEAVPGFAVLPAWVLVVGSIAIWGTVSPAGRPPGD